MNVNDFFTKNCREANEGLLENATLLTHETTDPAFTRVRFSEPYEMGGGVAVANYVDEKGERNFLLSSGSHTLLVGSTGSGKTQGFYLPQIDLIANSVDKPSFLAMDMKGLMYREKADLLRKMGYEVVVLNGKDPFLSARFNPMKSIYRAFHNAHDAERLFEQTRFGLPEYEFRGRKFDSYYDWKAEVEAYANEEAEASEQLSRMLVETLVPIESKKDTSWEQGAREIVSAVIRMLLEDSLYPERGMTEEKFTLYNVSLRVNDRSDDYRLTRKLLSMREPTSPALKLNNYVESAAKITRDSFMMTAGDKMCRIVNRTMNVMSTGSEVDVDAIVDDLGKKHIAVFCVADSSNKAAYTLCGLFMIQLVAKLQRRGDERDDGDFHIFADEFCNMVPMPEIVDWITTMRSRRVWFHLGVQSFSQLEYHYDRNVLDTILGNSKTIFMGSNDYKTLQTFSDSMGKRGDVANTFSMNNDGAVHLNASAVSVPLVKVSELASVHLGEAYVRIFGTYGNKLLKTVLEPNFRCPDLAHDDARFERRRSGSFCEELLYYDVNAIEVPEKPFTPSFRFGSASYETEESLERESGVKKAGYLNAKEKAYWRRVTKKRSRREADEFVRSDEKVLSFRPHLVEIGLLAHGFTVRLNLTETEYEAFVAELEKAYRSKVVSDETDDFDTENPLAVLQDEDSSDEDEETDRGGTFYTFTSVAQLVRKQINFFLGVDKYSFTLPCGDGEIRLHVRREGEEQIVTDSGETLSYCDETFRDTPGYTKAAVNKILDRFGVYVEDEPGGRRLCRVLSEEGSAIKDVCALHTCAVVLRDFPFFHKTRAKKTQ